jgi:tetratricopeptide (TPR) repeat protein
MTCPDAETLARYAEAGLEGAAAEQVRQHVDGCASCRELLVTLVRTSHPSPGPASDSPWDIPLPGTMLGRYRVTGSRGAGGMGVVLSAYDPQLDRQVAIKLLRPDLDGEEKGRLRLVREAQLMARVRHANVVTVHDVGVEHERVFIAMELVEGQTLRDWLEGGARGEAEVLATFLDAGRGLAAAHAAGVVHRDFKPENVLLDARGQVLVSDFGLAWSEAVTELPPGVGSPSSSLLSRRSSAIGTPAYMAPEQLAREPVDARADQFSFCVALWEALAGARPFEVKRGLPARVEAALRRGLSAKPAERFANMEALLDALQPRRRNTTWLLVAAGAVLALAGGGVRWRDVQTRCGPGRERLELVWPMSQRDAFAARPNVAPLGSELTARVSGLVMGLRGEWERSCGGPDERLRTCLLARIDALEVTAKVLAESQSNVRASSALVSRLEGPESCIAGEVLTLLPVPEGKGALVQRARTEALTADAFRFSGDLPAAEKSARAAIESAKEAGWRPVEADARVALAQVFRARGRFKEAEEELSEALLAAEAGRHFEAIARIAVQHVLVVGTQTNRPEEAEPWVRRAEAALEQLPRPRLRAEVDVALTMLRVSQGKFDDALAVSERALKWAEVNDPVSTADLRTLRSLNFLQFGFDSRALDEANVAAEARVRLLGAGHPLSLHARLTQGELNARCGHVKRGLEQLTSALDDARAGKELNAVGVATGMVGLSLALELGGQPAEALNAMKQADELVKSAVGLKHRYSALSTRALAERSFAVGRDDDAFALMQSALEVGAAAVGETHRETLETKARLALMHARRGKAQAADEARAVVEAVQAHPEAGEAPLVAARLALALMPDAGAEERKAALAIARKVRGPIHPDVLRVLLLEKEKSPALEEQLQMMEVDPNSLSL